jgi:hypothetical protein
MNRRHFLFDTTALAGAALLALPGHARTLLSDTPKFSLARLDRARGTFMPAQVCAGTGCTDADVRLSFDAFHPAEPEPVLHALRVHALFDAAGAPQTPYRVWDYRAERAAGNSRGVSFVAGRECMRHLALDYQLGQGCLLRTKLALTDLAEPLLQTGDYVLAGPQADGRAAHLDGLRYSGSPARPLLAERGRPLAFDYLAFRIEAMA